APVRLRPRDRALLVGPDEPRVTRDVRCENGGEPTLHGWLCSVGGPTGWSAVGAGLIIWGVRRGFGRCACRKSDSAILMMKTAEDWAGCNSADALNCPMERRVFVERAMNSRHIIISSILPKDPTEVPLPEHDHVVETFPSDRADQSLRVRILPRRARG